MSDTKQIIITLNAKSLFDYFPKKPTENDQCFKLDFSDPVHSYVVTQEITREDCPLFHQIYEVLKKRQGSSFQVTEKTLYDKFLIVDFQDIFLSFDKSSDPTWKLKDQEFLQKDAQDLIEHGFDLYFPDSDKAVHMSAFDKSGNMTRHSRISFIDETLYDELNLRLNLGIDFFGNKIKIAESKYYAYRGLYLSSSKRIDSEKLLLTPETFVVVQDERIASGKREDKPATGYKYQRNVPLLTAERTTDSDGTIDYQFLKPKTEEFFYVDTPFDGSGFITPAYAHYVNASLRTSDATSFQIRLPFIKGMLHEVDVHAFLNEYNSDTESSTNWYADAFGIKRDLYKAHIFVTKSMFKAYSWLSQYCAAASNEGKTIDPMEFYCNALKKYDHALYISGTNLPYGQSKYTHLSYQMINTLDFSETQFEHILDKHCSFIENPIDYLKDCDDLDDENIASGDDANDTDESENIFADSKSPVWKKALFKNPALANDIYIKSQLQNIQKGLLTKLVSGKLLVEGQTRYLCRDLLPLLVSLLENETDMGVFFRRYLYGRFYLPMNKYQDLGLNYLSYYAFFRSPHLSRNEQLIMQRFTDTDEAHYTGDSDYYKNHFKGHLELYERYFGKLTGIVMVPRGSAAPLCLGGADFDGDLVNVIFHQDVVNAVASGCYKKNTYKSKKLDKESCYYERILPIITIPALASPAVELKAHVPFEHIKNTFSNRIGLISNASISIGQTEYGKPLNSSSNTTNQVLVTKSNASSAPVPPSCEHCTLLTGLEIDAAKNGKHPNLDPILKDQTHQNSYLTFLKKWKQLRSEENYYFSNLTVKNSKSSNEEKFTISAKDCRTNATFSVPDYGTCINKLPGRFRDELEKYKAKEKVRDNTLKLFLVPKRTSAKNSAAIKIFETQCREILSTHFFYIHSLLPIIREEKKEVFYAPENLQRNLFQIYDEETAIQLQRITVPALKSKIQEHITESNTIQDMRTRLLQEQWLLQPSDHRGKALEYIIGNGFKEASLDETERELLFHFYQQGYKTLWLILSCIKVPTQDASFDVLKEKAIKQMEKSEEKRKSKKASKEELPPISSYVASTSDFIRHLDNAARDFYVNNDANAQRRIYRICLRELEELIDHSSVDMGQLITTLHKLTRTSSENRNFFWDAFVWEDIDSHLKGSDTTC